MAKHKRRGGESFNDFLKRIEAEKQIKGKDIEADIKEQISDRVKNQEKFLALNFYLITTNDDFNFNYLRDCKDKDFKSDFLRRLCESLYEITKHKVKELMGGIFNDKFTYKSYYKFYKHPSQDLNDEVELISIKLGGEKEQRMVCWKKNPNDNVLYVLGFQFTFDKPIYKH